ncbi:MAG: methyl-accepting chemotaxis protein [Nitrospirota bacterium]|nr:methyl-accepting chemotaxis protein [Nitrospirota bacterium]
MTIKARLMMMVGFMSALLIVVGATGIRGMRDIAHDLETTYKDRVVPLADLKEVGDLYGVTTVYASHDVRVGKMQWDEGLRNIRDYQKRVGEHWAAFAATEMSTQEQRLANQAEAQMADANRAVATVIGIMEQRNMEALTEFNAQKLYDAMGPLQETLDELAQLQVDVAKEEYDKAEAEYHSLFRWTIIFIVGGVLLGALVGYWVIRAVTGPLDNAVRVMTDVADGNGDLTQRLDDSGSDEVALLAGAYNRCATHLQNVLLQVRQSAETLALSSGELAEGAGGLSSRTQEQSASLEETSSAMEQITASVKQNSSSVTQANQLSSGARTQATTGSEVVGRAVASMNELSESSRKIREIIGMVGEISFQTNLLALNAAVEAARAGEHGRGFAVVASEVRSLAQRAANAASDIKRLIEESVGRVSGSSELVVATGQALTEIRESITRVNDIVAEIDAATREQADSITQVNNVMGNMDEVTQQNAALVEETAAATDSVAQEAGRLAELMAMFKLDEGRTQTHAAKAHAPAAQSAGPRRAASTGFVNKSLLRGIRNGKQPLVRRTAVTGLHHDTSEGPEPVAAAIPGADGKPMEDF